MKNSILFIILWSLSLLISCDDNITTNEGISFMNETDHVVHVSFIYDSGKQDSLLMEKKGFYYGFNLFSFNYNKKEIMDSTVLLNQIKNLKIFRVANSDTIYVNPINYNKFKCWTDYITVDMRDRTNYYVLSVTPEMFE
jgi:hypothetical protein